MSTSTWVSFGPSATPAAAQWHAPAPAPYGAPQYPHVPAQQQQQQQHLAYANTYSYQPQPQLYAAAYPTYQQAHLQWAPAPVQSSLVLYDPNGMAQSFQQQQQQKENQQRAKSNVNPFVPGLAPLPVVPPPTTFAAPDAVKVKFPNSSKNASDTLSWITQEIFDDVTRTARSESAAQRTPLKELRQMSSS